MLSVEDHGFDSPKIKLEDNCQIKILKDYKEESNFQ
jgi:hypothetical protein